MTTDPTLPPTEAVGEVRRRSENRQLTELVGVRLPPEEHERALLLAARADLTVASLLRGLLRDHIEEIAEVEAALADPAPHIPAEAVLDHGGWLPPLAAEKLFEQRDTAIAEAQVLRERVRVAGTESRRLIAKAEAERDRMRSVLDVIAHRRRFTPDAMAMEPGDAQRTLAAIFEAVDAYNATKEASDAG